MQKFYFFNKLENIPKGIFEDVQNIAKMMLPTVEIRSFLDTNCILPESQSDFPRGLVVP